MTSETDEQFVERVRSELYSKRALPPADAGYLIALARRGAAMQDHERKVRAWIGDPSRPVTFSAPPTPADRRDE